MKIAKKMLAVVVALIMVAGMSAMAFAAGTPAIKLVFGEIETNEDGDDVVIANIVLQNCVGFKSADIVVNYDTAVLELNYISTGADADAVSKAKATVDGKTVDNNVNFASNDEVPGATKCAFTFAHELTEKFKNEKGKEIKDVDTENFNVVEMEFKVLNKEAADTTIVLEGKGAVGSADVAAEGAKLVINKNAKPAEKDTQPAEKDTQPAEKDTQPAEKDTQPANPNTGDQKTGDTVALVAVAGVVAVAGAAFIVSKKRK